MSFREFNYLCPECSNPIRWYTHSQQWGCDTCGWTGDDPLVPGNLPAPDMNLASQETRIVESQETPSSASEIDVPSDADEIDPIIGFPIDAEGSRIYYSENPDEYMYWYEHGVERWRDEDDGNIVTIIEYRDFNLTSTRWVGVRLGDKIRICIKDRDGIMYKYPEGKIVKVNNKYYFQIAPEDIENSNLNFDHYEEPGELINVNASGNLIGINRGNDQTDVFINCELVAAEEAVLIEAQRERMPVASRSVVTPGSAEYDAIRTAVREAGPAAAAEAAESSASSAAEASQTFDSMLPPFRAANSNAPPVSLEEFYRVPRRRALRAAPEGKVESELQDEKSNELENKLTELENKLTRAQYYELARHPSISFLYKKKARDIIMLEDTPILTLLEDKDNIVFQLDKEPFNAVVTTLQTLTNLLYNPDYLKHTKYQCTPTRKGEQQLQFDETDIVIPSDESERHKYKFINGIYIGIYGGLLLRSQLEKILIDIAREGDAAPRHFLYHIHNNIKVGPIISADKVGWSKEPSPDIGIRSISYRIPYVNELALRIFHSDPWQQNYSEAHRPVGGMMSADHCQEGSYSLISLMPVRSRFAFVPSERPINKRKSSGASGKKTKRLKGGRRKRTRRKKWSNKYKKSINCKHPKGFSQKQYCKYGRKTKRKRRRKKKTKRRRKRRR